MNEGTVDIWVVKYALTQGVFKKEAKLQPSGSFYVTEPLGCFDACYHAGDVALSAEEAAQKVALLRERKIRSAEKALKKLREQVIEIPE